MNVPDFPKRIELELVSACNLKCTYCPRRFMDELKDFMDIDLFTRLIDELAAYPETILVLHRRGESLLHPRFIDMMTYLRGKFQTLQLATNATRMTPEIATAMVETLTFVSFSIDLPHRYDQIRKPAKYEDVATKIGLFLELNAQRGNPVQTQVSMVRTRSVTDEDVKTFETLWQNRVDRVRIYEEHSADGNFGSLAQKRPERKPCVMPFYEMLVYADGKIGRCNHDWNGEPIGDLLTQGIKEVWHGQIYRVLRKQQTTLNINDPVCAPCDSWYPEEGVQGTGKVVAQ